MATASMVGYDAPAPVGVRFCTCCLAIYRQDFQRCPLDGGKLVVEATDPWIGLTVGGHYSIDKLVGEGAMGRVYRARHVAAGTACAIKILIGDLAATATMRARFALEAEHASKLCHPNVVGVVDFGATEHGVSYLVMDLVEGPTLGAILMAEPLRAERVIRLARQLCEGLDHAHGRGVIHRDFKPENILVVGEGEREVARIADFGLAMLATSDARLTTTGVVCTPAYAAPEQLRGLAIDHRVDLYALGTSMFEMLSGGTLPFNGEIDETVANKLANEAPSVLTVAPDAPPALVAIIGRLLAPAPERRPQSARAVIRALDQALRAPGVPLRADQTARWRRPRPASELPLDGLVPTRRDKLRRAAVQLIAFVVTLAGGLAWIDLRDEPIEDDPVLAAVAAPATSAAAAAIETSIELDVEAIESIAGDFAAAIDISAIMTRRD